MQSVQRSVLSGTWSASTSEVLKTIYYRGPIKRAEIADLLGLTKAEYDGLSEEERKTKKEAARRKYLEAGADLVIDSIRELPEAVEKLNKAAKGEYGNEQLL